MNLMEYRAMKLEESQPSPEVVETVTPEQPEPTEPIHPDVPALPETIEINGENIPFDELRNGYLRQSDYTRKTQELSAQRRQMEEAMAVYESVKGNPEIAEKLNYDVREAEFRAMQANYNDLLLQQEINTLSSKYADFNVDEVVNLAVQKGLNNLEDAYLLNKSFVPPAPKTHTEAPSVDVETIKAQIRQELLAEMQTTQNTSSIISSNSGIAPLADNSPKLSDAELAIARKMRMTPEEYVKWR